MLKPIDIITSEHGTTLVEVLVYMVLLVVIMAGAYTIYEGSEAIYTSTSDMADAQRSGRLAQLGMTKHLRMAESFVAADDYNVDFRADIDDDNLWETVNYYVENDRLYKRVDGGAAKEIAKGVMNISQSQPLFLYYDKSGSAITTDTASRKTKSCQIGINLVIDIDTNRPPEPYALTSKVTLRNKD